MDVLHRHGFPDVGDLGEGGAQGRSVTGQARGARRCTRSRRSTIAATSALEFLGRVGLLGAERCSEIGVDRGDGLAEPDLLLAGEVAAQLLRRQSPRSAMKSRTLVVAMTQPSAASGMKRCSIPMVSHSP